MTEDSIVLLAFFGMITIIVVALVVSETLIELKYQKRANKATATSPQRAYETRPVVPPKGGSGASDAEDTGQTS